MSHMFFVLLVLALFFILPDLYISLVLLRGAAWWAHVMVWLPAIVTIVLLASIRFFGVSSVKMDVIVGLLLCIALPQLLFVFISLIGRLTSLAWSPASSAGNWAGIAVGAIVSIAMLYGLLFGWKQLTVKNIELAFDNLPTEFEGYRIAQLSDLHVGTYGSNTAFLEKVVRRVDEEHPDLVVFTGDIINTSPEEMVPFENTLSRLSAEDGVMSVTGNHDYCLYGFGERPSNPHEGAKKVVEAERHMGWQVLLNEHRLVTRDGVQIAVIGVENTGKPPFPEIGNLQGAMEGLPDGIFSILLSHDPSHWRMEVLPKTDIPLMLSGHTHAAQLKIGSWSPSRWFYKEWGGLYQEDGQSLFISEGTGGSIPFRLGATPEIIIITLRRSK